MKRKFTLQHVFKTRLADRRVLEVCITGKKFFTILEMSLWSEDEQFIKNNRKVYINLGKLINLSDEYSMNRAKRIINNQSKKLCGMEFIPDEVNAVSKSV